MLLIINCIADEVAKGRFDQHTVPRLTSVLEENHEIRHLVGTESLGTDAGCDRLILSGSELSAAEELATDDRLLTLIRAFAEHDKPILGICYGHQMVARAFGGHCRKAAVPEFGWKKITTVPNELFADLEHPVTLHSHYDEVHDLPDTFRVLAKTDDCQVQAFQVVDRPIWGVQFHPEMGHTEGQRMLDSNLKTEPLAPELYVDELDSPRQADDNLQLFRNFFRARRRLAAAS